MQEATLFRKYTMLGLLDQIDLIEGYEQQGKAVRYSEVTKNQAEIYEALGVREALINGVHELLCSLTRRFLRSNL